MKPEWLQSFTLNSIEKGKDGNMLEGEWDMRTLNRDFMRDMLFTFVESPSSSRFLCMIPPLNAELDATGRSKFSRFFLRQPGENYTEFYQATSNLSREYARK
jgi:hypothetical protein